MIIRRLKLAPRAFLFFSAIVAIVLALGILSVFQMKKLYDAEQDVENNWTLGIRYAGQMHSGLLRLRLESLRGATTSDEGLRQQTVAAFPGYRAAFMKAVKQYEATVSGDDDQALYNTIRTSVTGYDQLLNQFEPLLRSGDGAAASALINSTIRPLTNTLEGQIDNLVALNDKGAAAAGKAAGAVYASSRAWVIGLIAAAVLTTIALAVLLIRSITQPIGEAVAIAQRIARKDLTEQINAVGQDEAASMLAALAQMQGNLRQTITHISDSSAQLAAAAEEMTAVTEDASRGLLRQNDEVDQAASAVTQMSSAVDEVARNAAEAASASAHTQSLTNEGLGKVAQTLTAIQALATNVGTTSTQVQMLSTRAKEINTVVEVIRSIAEQTNLLALNAAIEAARAGEQGRGFAVVADEVRSLAGRTSASTQEITAMVARIQHSTREAVTSMEAGVAQVDKGMAVTAEVEQSIRDILDATLNTTHLVNDITRTIGEQSLASNEIAHQVETIARMSESNSQIIGTTATTTDQLSAMADQLSQSVDRFRL